jgi:hypothetical protein
MKTHSEYIFVILDKQGDVNCAAETEELAQQLIDENEGGFDYVKAKFFVVGPCSITEKRSNK